MTTTQSPRSTISDLEASLYYHGLRSKPVLVARTGINKWLPPTGPEAYLVPKIIRTTGYHKLQGLWEETIAPQMHMIMEADGISWTSTDVVRIGYATETAAQMVVWIGVMPKTLSREHGHTIAVECKKILFQYKINDVEVEIRETMVTRYAGPPLQAPVPTYNPIAELLEPLTSTLGLPICSENILDANGTAGFYVTDSDSRIYFITARHVFFGADDHDNRMYNRKVSSQPRINALLFGPARFNTYLKSIEDAIVGQRVLIAYGERCLKAAGDDQARQDHANIILAEASKKIDAFQKHYDYVTKHWGETTNRILGFLRFSPPIVLNEKAFRQDYALVEMDRDKIDPDSFTGNALDLGTEISPERLTQLLYSNPRNCHNFKYPPERIFKIQGIISKKVMSNPDMLDQNEMPCLLVMKRGLATGLTLGRANEINSFARTYFTNTSPKKSLEWVICNYDSKSPLFAAPGDSGAAIVDCQGRLGGVVTGGHDIRDLTYATPAFSILDSLKTNGFKVTIEVPTTA